MERLAGKVILLWGWRRALVAFLAGALAVLAQAPYDFFAVGFVSFPVLVWLLDGATAFPPAGLLARLRPAFATGWWFGLGYFLAGLWWVGNALLVEADDFAWALPLAVLGLPAVLALFYGAAATLARLLWSGGIGRIAALALGFGIAEWLRAVVLTGFPWNPIGLMAMPVPLLMQSAALAGTIGMTVLAVFVFAMPALLAARGHRTMGAVLAASLIALHAGYGYWALSRPAPADARQLTVRIVQPAVDQAEKWDAAVRDRIFRTLLDLSSVPQGQPKPELVLWPETSVPFLLTDRPDALVAIGDLLEPGQLLLAGVVRAEGEPAAEDARYYNSVMAINDAGEIVDAVDKVHLVPFGEYLPFQSLLEGFGVQKVVALPLDFEAGAARHPIALPGGVRAVPFVCYEIIFPDLVGADTSHADLIVSVTNDAWFGDTPGPYQHFRQAQIRAVETGLPAVRAANTGISGIIDERGRVVDALTMDARGAIDATLRLSGSTRDLPGTPRLNGLVMLGLFAVFAGALAARSRARLN